MLFVYQENDYSFRLMYLVINISYIFMPVYHSKLWEKITRFMTANDLYTTTQGYFMLLIKFAIIFADTRSKEAFVC